MRFLASRLCDRAEAINGALIIGLFFLPVFLCMVVSNLSWQINTGVFKKNDRAFIYVYHLRTQKEGVLFCFVGVGLDWPLGATLRAICDEEDHQ